MTNDRNKKSISWIDKAREGGNVQRIHTMHTFQPYNNAIHTFNAIIIAKEICVELNTEDQFVIDYLLIHDLPECWTGDIPAPVKKLSSVKSRFDKLEEEWYEEHMPEHYASIDMLSKHERAICKCADYLELSHFCSTEYRMGNRSIRPVLINAANYIRVLNRIVISNTVNDMLDHCLEGVIEIE